MWVRSVLALAVVLVADCALAADFLVDRTDDVPSASACTDAPDDCSLRGAVTAANAAAPAASSIIVPGGSYLLTQTVTCNHEVLCGIGQCPLSQDIIALCINAPVTITGAGAGVTILDGDLTTPLALVSADAVVDLSNVTVTHGRHEVVLVTDKQVGGAIINHGTLHVHDSMLADNAAVTAGGAIYTAGSLTVSRSVIRDNFVLHTFDGAGGGVFGDVGASMSVIDSTIANNTTASTGGGVHVRQGSLTVRGSTISNNATTFADGGGIYAFGPATIVITNSTISGNHAGFHGGGIQLWASTEARLRNVTITGNMAAEYTNGTGGGLQATGSTVALRNTIIAGNAVVVPNAAWPDLGCSTSTALSEGYNLVGDPTGCALTGDLTGNLTGDPKLGPLADNDGGTETHALAADSPAVDAGNPAGCTDDDGVELASDQRGRPREVDGNGDGTPRCDLGAFEFAGGGGGGLSLNKIHPVEGGDAGSVTAVVHGGGFEAGATVTLVRSGEPDIVGAGTTVSGNGTVVTTRFDLTGKALGAWDVVVANPDTKSGALPAAFTIAPARPPDLWVELIGPEAIRSRRPTRYLLRYGNRGNTDAYAVPLLFAASDIVFMAPRFPIAPPPEQFGKTTILEWGQYYREILDTGEEPSARTLPLLVPVVAAGSSETVEVQLYAPRTVDDKPFSVRLEIADPLFAGAPLPEAVVRLVRGAREKSARLFGYTLPTSVDGLLDTYTTTHIQRVVDDGGAAYVASGGTEPNVYSLSQLAYDIASYGLIAAQLQPPPAATSPDADASAVERLSGPAFSAADDISCVCGSGPKAAVCCPGCLCPRDDGEDTIKAPKSCLARLDEIGKGDCKPPETPRECREIGFDVIRGLDKDGRRISICTNNPKCILSNPVGGANCVRFPVRTVVAYDPNDKTGPIGGGTAHYIRPEVPLAYTIRFENKPDATAPAAEVVITDQLDPDRVEFSSLTLGPVGFGATQWAPPPGSAAFTTDLDLRPANELIVRVAASLDDESGVITWRFTSLDPQTMQPPEDALAGFLPPNADPPEGDGYVSFTIAAKPGLASGTTISNGADIVFDANDPIVTPVWSNTIDSEPPASQVVSVEPAGACAQDLAVGWSGSDPTSAAASFAVSVAEDGGPFEAWLATDAASGLFRGRWGKSYAFRTVATDAAGNVETEPGAASAPVAVPACGPFDLATTKIGVPKAVKLTAKRPARTALVKVVIQNRSAQAQSIADADTLASIVSATITPLGPACPSPTAVLRTDKPQKALPLTLASKRSLPVVFEVVFDCAVDPAKGKGHEDFAVTATVDQSRLGGIDAHAADDACPRPGQKPAPKDEFPDGKLTEKGCGAKAGGVRAGAVLIDVVR